MVQGWGEIVCSKPIVVCVLGRFRTRLFKFGAAICCSILLKLYRSKNEPPGLVFSGSKLEVPFIHPIGPDMWFEEVLPCVLASLRNCLAV